MAEKGISEESDGKFTKDTSTGFKDRKHYDAFEQTSTAQTTDTAEADIKSSRSSRRAQRLEPEKQRVEESQEEYKSQRKRLAADDDGEVVFIPDLEEENLENIESKVAEAPRNISRRLPTMRELDADTTLTSLRSQSGIDLSLLAATLVSPDMLDDDEDGWTFERLLQDVTQQMSMMPSASKGARV